VKIAIFYEHRDIGSSGLYAERALRSLGHEVKYFRKHELETLRERFDLYVRTEDGHFGYRFRSAGKVPAVYWTHDTHVPYSIKCIKKEASEYSYIFAAHQSGIRPLADLGYCVEWLPLGCDPELHGRVEVPMAYEVAFIGKEEGIPRKFLLQEIRERYERTFIRKAHFSKMASVYSASKTGFNQAINRDLNMRAFEVLCSGALLVTSDVEDNEYEQIGLLHGKHLIVFSDPRDLFKQLDYYLSHESERKTIADAGRAQTLARHTYRHRMEAMLDTLKRKGIISNSSLSSTSLVTKSAPEHNTSNARIFKSRLIA